MARHYKLFGTFEISKDGVPSRLLQSLRGSALVSYLIVTNEAQTREHLADLLWESRSTSDGLKRLRQLISRIRPLIPELQTNRQTVSFQSTPDTVVDLWKLEQAIATNDNSKIENTLPLCEGPLLNNFQIENSIQFNEWLVVVREQWHKRVFDQYRQLCQRLLNQEEWHLGIEVCRRWLLLDDLNEEAYRRLMQMLVGLGEYEAALTEYETCRQVLWDELSVEPGQSIVQLAEDITNQQVAIATTEIVEGNSVPLLPKPGELVKPGPLPIRSIMPYHRNDDFTGRECELSKLAAQLLPYSDKESSSPRAVTISGMGGVGKTQLAVEFCYRYGRFFPGGIFWMNFENPETVVEEIASIGGQSGMGLFQEADQLTLADRVGRVTQAWQNQIPKLLIFDNCEEEDLLAKWLPVTGESRVLVTSQRGVWSPNLSMIHHELSVLQSAESISMLQKMHPQIDETVAAEIAKEIGDLPLGLHLAGSFLRQYSQITPSDYLTQLQQKSRLQHPSLQGRGTSYSPTAHQLNVEKTIELNYSQLDEENETDQIAIKLLLHASLFAPGESLPKDLLFSTVLSENPDMMELLKAEDGLIRLKALGLLEREDTERVTMHKLIAAYTIEKAADLQSAFLPVIKTVTSTITNSLEKYSYLGVLPLTANHVSTIVTTALQLELVEIIQLIPLWTRHLRDGALFDYARRVSQQALTLCEKKLPPNHIQTASILIGLGIANMRLGNYQEAKKQLTQCLNIREKQLEPNHQDLAQSYNGLGIVLVEMGEFKLARPYLEKTLQIWLQNLGASHPRVAIANNNLGSLLTDLEEFDEAEQFIDEAYKIWEQSNGAEHPLTAHAIHNKGALFLKIGEHKRAQALIRQAYTIRKNALGINHPSTSDSLHYLGQALMKVGQFEEAYSYLTQSLENLGKRFHAEHPALAPVHISLSEWHFLQGNDTLNKEHDTKAVQIFEKSGILSHPVLDKYSLNSLRKI